MSTGFLANYALRTIWCSPFEDEQSIIELKRITPINGAVKEVNVFQDRFTLPDKIDYYHVFMIGGNHPIQLSFPYRQEEWIKLSDWCMLSQLVAYIYTEKGILFPLSQTYILREDDENFLVAIRISEKLPDLNIEKCFIHLYHNQYWTVDVKQKLNEQIVCLGAEFRKSQEMQLVQNKVIEYTNKGLAPHVFLNGKMVEGYRLNEDKDDIQEMMVDGSIYKEFFFNVSTLPHFQSKLDKEKKYLLHLPKNQSGRNDIYYRDDITIFLVKIPELNHGEVAGAKIVDSRYYHRNREDSLRMITHQDYAIPVDYVSALIRSAGESMNYDKWYIRMVVRRSGVNRQLINEKQHIRELYRLEDKDIVGAMIGSNATIDVWRAENLEASMYTYLMRAYRHEIDDEKTIKALGYVSAARVLANPCISITRNPNGDYFHLPIGLVSSCMIYEYDRTGKLLGYYPHQGNVRYYAKHKTTIFVEAIAGHGSHKPDIRVNPSDIFPLYPLSQYRVYASPFDEKGIVTTFRDVTREGKYFHRTEDNQGIVKYNPEKEALVVMGDGQWLAYDYEIDASDGAFDFSLVSGDNQIPILVPYGKLDLWMNGYSLVEGIDYFVKFPLICVVAKRYIDDEKAKQTITVRATGFCNSEMKRILPREVGFITYGKISCDDHYDLHDENISRINVAGAIIDPRVLQFDKRTGEASVKPFQDALPFSIEDYYIPLRGFRGIDLYQEFEEDKQRTSAISDYLTKFLPNPEREKNPDIPREYQVYSPLMSRMITDIESGRLVIGRINSKDRMTVERIVNKYKRFLEVDPAYLGFDYDYVTVHPVVGNHQVTVEYRVYEFLDAVNKLYFENAINLNHWLKVAAKQRG